MIGEFSADLLVMVIAHCIESLYLYFTSFETFTDLLPFNLYTQALVFFCKKSQLEVDLEKEIREIKSKMDEISMVDEFAKYAKLQRKLNRLQQELKVESTFSLGIRVTLSKIVLISSCCR